MDNVETCRNYKDRQVKLGYVSDSPTSVQLVNAIGSQVFDLLPIVQAGETDTKLELNLDAEAIRYYPEEYTRTNGESGCYWDVCIDDLAALIYLNDLRDVNIPEPTDGTTLLYNGTNKEYEAFDLTGAFENVDSKIANLQSQIDSINSEIDTLGDTIESQNTTIATLSQRISRVATNLETLTTDLDTRLSAIESAIYNWTSDKTTKIARGNINVTSGGATSGNGIYTRSANTDNDLNFE